MYGQSITSPPALREFRAHFQALASVTRLRILQYLAGAPETTVQDLADALGLSQPRLSWHLRMLRRGQLVTARRAGRAVYCSLNREGLHAYQRELSSLIAPRPKVRALNERSEVHVR
ncbi:MAG TPA: metalloregulator ArsR/SmtB family transcription factor [Candidatus Limnocylindrales bacterium]|nr:metalloregulator ArsR/SmtB family transcription factor [Candidatus Limnocylindrales bacterium]